MQRKPLPSAAVIEKLPPDGGEEFNRLIFEKSPYLLQHARNPVDWYPWGPEAFEAAREQDKPVFLSIGYSACHWCHVMEHESFEDEEVAALLNQLFIPVKVDREERPDVDKVYMDVTQRMTGGGGWPMTVIMTPDQEPFFAGTYFPKFGMPGRPGVMDILATLGQAWTNDRQKITSITSSITQDLAQLNKAAPGEMLTRDTLKAAYENFKSRYDRHEGGFSGAPKFPMPHGLMFLVRYRLHFGAQKAYTMAEHTLRKMRLGGIYDHVGFGFHRYSTDAQWLLPHFEKMLYDQALLSMAYLDAFQYRREPLFEQTAREIFTYVLRDMTHPEGGFYSAEDADSEGEEGRFYIWSNQEVQQVLGDDAELFIETYNLEEGGNFQDQATGKKVGASIPHLTTSLSELAAKESIPIDFMLAKADAARLNLFAAREERVHPLKDDKILTDWNGLMIAALARGVQVLGDQHYLEAAQKAADFVHAHLRNEEGRLLKRYREGEAKFTATLEDYAFMIWGLVELYQAGFETRNLAWAVSLAEQALEQYQDEKAGGFYLTPDDGEELLVRAREFYDGAIPSGNSVMALALVKLSRLTGRPEFEEAAARTIQSFSGIIEKHPDTATVMLMAADLVLNQGREVVMVGDRETPAVQALIDRARAGFRPGTVFLLKEPGDELLPSIAPFTEHLAEKDGRATFYVCRNFACELPVNEPDKALELMDK